MVDEQKQNEQSGSAPKAARRGAQEQALASHAHKSYWPILLALALFMALIGLLANLVVFIVGVALMAVAIIGWSLERL